MLRAAKRLLTRSGKQPSRSKKEHGFAYMYVDGRWCAGWYESYFGAVPPASGAAMACAQPLQDVPASFGAFYLLCKLAKQNAPRMVGQRATL